MSKPLEVFTLVESMFALDGGAMFGIIPKPLWMRTNPADERNRIDLACRSMVVRYADYDVLVDVGMGTRWNDKERDIYKIAGSAPDVKPLNVKHVILTHLHFDHAGGLSFLNDSNELQASFKDAKHWVQRANWGWAHTPSARDQGSYRPEELQIFEKGLAEMELIDGIAEILPGIEVLPMNGHTFGMQVVKVTTESGRVYAHLADLVPTTSHLRDPYVMGYDINPLDTVKEKREVLYEAAKSDWTLVFGHDPKTDMARVEMHDSVPKLVHL